MFLQPLEADEVYADMKFGVVRRLHGMTERALNSGNHFFLPEMRQGRVNQHDQRISCDNALVSVETRSAQRNITNTPMKNIMIRYRDGCIPVHGISRVFSALILGSYC